MKRYRFNLFIILSLCFAFGCGYERSDCISQTAEIHSGQSNGELPRVFIDCDECDMSYIRNQIKFVNYVRDPQVAQIYVLITSQRTASGGRKFRLAFMGRENFAGQDHRLSYVSQEFHTKDEERQGLIQVLKVGLLNYVMETRLASRIDISYKDREATQRTDESWNYWVFHIDAGGELEAESNQSELSLKGAVSASRITELWKVESGIEFEQGHESYEDGDETIRSTRTELEAEFTLVGSLTDHWSCGILGQIRHDTYRNTAIDLRTSPALEYNIFPWKESDHRALTIQYGAGLRSFKYIEETIYNRMAESLLFQALDIELEMIQPWGSIKTRLEGSHFFKDLAKNKLEIKSDLALRIFKGLSVTFQINATILHDQLYLAKGDATREEILLKQRQMATDFELDCSLGLRYTFGSIYSNIVNKRF